VAGKHPALKCVSIGRFKHTTAVTKFYYVQYDWDKERSFLVHVSISDYCIRHFLNASAISLSQDDT